MGFSHASFKIGIHYMRSIYLSLDNVDYVRVYLALAQACHIGTSSCGIVSSHCICLDLLLACLEMLLLYGCPVLLYWCKN